MNTDNYRYKEQQEEINFICADLGLIPFRPNYHGDKKDKNTVLIYTRDNAKYNKELEKDDPFARFEQFKPYILYLENSDINGKFNFDFMNFGKIDLRSYFEWKKILREYIGIKLKEYNEKENN